MIKKIICFRHGLTDLNKEGIIQDADADFPLNKEGIEQAKELQEVVKKDIEVIYTSPLIRAVQTADILNEKLNVPVFKDDGLKEIQYGIFAMKKMAEMEKEYPTHYQMWYKSTEDYIIPEMPETKYKAGERLINTIKKIAKNDENAIIGISSHGRILAIARLLLTGIYKDLENCEIIYLEYNSKTDELKLVEAI